MHQFDNVWKHDFTVMVNPDGTFAGTGIMTSTTAARRLRWAETITGKFNADSTVDQLRAPFPSQLGGATFKVTDAADQHRG